MSPEAPNIIELENGLSLVFYDIEQDDTNVTFELEFDKPATAMTDLAELWTPESSNCLILRTLEDKGWVAKDAESTTLRHFQMDVSKSTDNTKWTFHYYVPADTPESEGLEMTN